MLRSTILITLPFLPTILAIDVTGTTSAPRFAITACARANYRDTCAINTFPKAGADGTFCYEIKNEPDGIGSIKGDPGTWMIVYQQKDCKGNRFRVDKAEVGIPELAPNMRGQTSLFVKVGVVKK